MENSKISWTHHTINFWMGCEKVSEGCDFCYAEVLMDKRYGKVVWGEDGERQLTSEKNRRAPINWNKKAQELGIRYRVFAQSLSDTFENREELLTWRLDMFKTIKETPNLDWLVLTKRPEVARDFFFTYPEFANLPNVWLGVSVENQEQANLRIPILLEIPARIRFLSCEPLLTPIELDFGVKCKCVGGKQVLGVRNYSCGETLCKSEPMIDWVIVGGESGHNARPLHIDWVRSIQKQCESAHIPFHFKQWGEYLPLSESEGNQLLDDKIIKSFTPPSQFARKYMLSYKVNIPDSGFINIGENIFAYCAGEETPYFLAKLGKHTAGNFLDGKQHLEFPNNEFLESVYNRENQEAKETLIQRYGSEEKANEVLDEISKEVDVFIDELINPENNG